VRRRHLHGAEQATTLNAWYDSFRSTAVHGAPRQIRIGAELSF
jgi:hypothetical protein